MEDDNCHTTCPQTKPNWWTIGYWLGLLILNLFLIGLRRRQGQSWIATSGVFVCLSALSNFFRPLIRNEVLKRRLAPAPLVFALIGIACVGIGIIMISRTEAEALSEQPANRPVLNAEGNQKPQPESEGSSR